VNLRLYRNPSFALGSVVQFMVTILFMSSTFLINIFLQRVYSFTPSQVGTLMFPQGVVYGLGSLSAGRLSDFADPRIPLVLGLAFFTVVYYWLGSISTEATALALLMMFCLRSFSFSCVNAPNMLMSLRGLPEEQVPMATGLFSVARGIAGTLGVALSATFLEYRRELHAIWLANEQGGLDLASQWTMTGLYQVFTSDGEAANVAQVKTEAHVYSLMQQEANVAAYQDVFLCSAFIALFSILPGLFRASVARARKEPLGPHTAAAEPSSLQARSE
jgi:DHA2 family multidrug resistance protein